MLFAAADEASKVYAGKCAFVHGRPMFRSFFAARPDFHSSCATCHHTGLIDLAHARRPSKKFFAGERKRIAAVSTVFPIFGLLRV